MRVYSSTWAKSAACLQNIISCQLPPLSSVQCFSLLTVSNLRKCHSMTSFMRDWLEISKFSPTLGCQIYLSSSFQYTKRFKFDSFFFIDRCSFEAPSTKHMIGSLYQKACYNELFFWRFVLLHRQEWYLFPCKTTRKETIALRFPHTT
jgi:hypothetical protein